MATESKLRGLLDKLADVMSEALEGQEIKDEEGNVVQVIAPSAATMSAISNFLKNNNITCAPSEDNAVGALKEKMDARRQAREARATPVDLMVAEEDMDFLKGLPN